MVRDMQALDIPAIARIHEEMGMDYVLPDLESPLFLVRKVWSDQKGVRGACMLRITAETYLMLDPGLRAPEKMRAMVELQPEVLESAWVRGLDEVEARIPMDVEKRFNKRLMQMGWRRNRDNWHAWTRYTR